MDATQPNSEGHRLFEMLFVGQETGMPRAANALAHTLDLDAYDAVRVAI